MNRQASLDDRRDALDALLAAKDPQLPQTLRELLRDPQMSGAALRGLAAYDDRKTPSAILDVYDSLNVAERRDALNTLASRASFARELLSGVRDERIPSQDLTAEIVRQLRTYRDEAINKQVVELWGVARESSADKQKEIVRYKRMIVAKKGRSRSASSSSRKNGTRGLTSTWPVTSADPRALFSS
jgi:hypothetical protein